MLAYLLVHSPLVGPLTWQPVAGRLRERGCGAVVAALETGDSDGRPFWQQHAAQVARAAERIEAGQRIILVGHSGAGVLLPAIRRHLQAPVAGYLFVDALLPSHMKSRLDLFESYESAEAAATFRQGAVEGHLPVWEDADLRDAIPDAELRARFVAELRPLPLAVYEEPIPVFAEWPDAPCGYLHFSPPYDQFVKQAEASGWPVDRLPASHFHMLADPDGVAGMLVNLAGRMGSIEMPSSS